MSTIHPDEATLLRSVLGELPQRRQAALKRHVARCRPCSKARDATKHLHERLSGAGDSLAFSAGDPFEHRPVSQDVSHAGNSAVRAMAAALGRVEGEKARVRAAIEVDAIRAALDLDLADAAIRLAAAHLLEEAAFGEPSKELSVFAETLSVRTLECEAEADAVVPGALLQALAHLVLGSWRLFAGRKDEATAELRAALAALGAFDAPEHLCACVEVGESLRRSYEGRPVEGRLLAERALETFERYGLGRGVLRARHARAVALYTVGEYREAHREFRALLGSKDATRLDRARAVSGAAFCLAARGRFHEAAKEYSPVRRKLKGDGAMTEQYLLQGEMKAALGTAGRWHPRHDGLAAFALPEAGGAFHARETAAEIVKAVSEEGLEKTKELLGKIKEDPSRGYVYLYSCQLVGPTVQTDTARFFGFAKAIAEFARCLPLLNDRDPVQPVCGGQVLGDVALLESYGLSVLGMEEEARTAAQKARVTFTEACEDSFSLALVDLSEGNAATFAGEVPVALKLLKNARSEFQRYGQENWEGRAESAMGLLSLYRGEYRSALRHYDGALHLLHQERDGVGYAVTLVNRGYLLIKEGRFGAARASYARGLLHARRLRLSGSLFNVRFGLAMIELLKGNVVRALRRFEGMAEDASRLGHEAQWLGARLRVAECLSKLGHSDEVGECIKAIRQSAYMASLSNDVGLRELFESHEQRATSTELIAHIADYIERKDWGVRARYKPFRLVKGGS